jgi:uncharacterized protein YecT (DUF1311 family)
MKSSVAIVVLTWLASGAAIAGPPSAAAREDCGAQQNQTEMNACYGRELDRADDRLNAAYKKRLDGMRDDPDGIRLLREAERAWLDFREKNCTVQAHGEEGGSIYSTMVATCRITMAEARTKEIQTDN